jgi:hypothetical protein
VPKWLSFACALSLVLAMGISVQSKSARSPSQKVPILATLKYDGKSPATLRYGDLVVTVDREAGSDKTDRLPFADGRYKGAPAFAIHLERDTNGAEEPSAEVRLIKIDPGTSMPQVVFTYFWAGAHCCTVTRVATIDTGETWHVLDGGALDGDEGYEFMDLDGDGGSELVSIDNSFLYAFGCYACSFAPTRIKKLVGTELRDVTMEGRYRTFLRQQLRRMEAQARKSKDRTTIRSTGYLAGWVAAKALVGELNEAWRTMLATHDRKSEWTYEECARPIPMDQCPEAEQRQVDFPTSLAAHLMVNGYITAEQKKRLPLK